MEEKKIDFEKQLKRLDEIVDNIQNKALPLDESLKLYEEGSEIIKELEAALTESEAKLEKVVSIEEK